MLKQKKKFSKKEIKKDKLVTFVSKSQNYFEEYKSKFVTYGLIVAAVIVAIYFYINQQMEDNNIAGTHLSRIMKIYDQGSYLQAIEGEQGTGIIGLKNIVEDYGSTENGETAKIYLANCYSFLGNYDEALKYFQDYGGSIDYYKASSIAGVAGYQAINGDYERAAELYFDAASISPIDAQNPDYLLNAGIYFLKAGNNEQAKKLFTAIKEEYGTSLAGREADKYLSLVN